MSNPFNRIPYDVMIHKLNNYLTPTDRASLNGVTEWQERIYKKFPPNHANKLMLDLAIHANNRQDGRVWRAMDICEELCWAFANIRENSLRVKRVVAILLQSIKFHMSDLSLMLYAHRKGHKETIESWIAGLRDESGYTLGTLYMLMEPSTYVKLTNAIDRLEEFIYTKSFVCIL